MKPRTYEDILRENKALERAIMRLSNLLKKNDVKATTARFDVELFDRLIHERNELEWHLIVAQETIRVQSERIAKLEEVTKHFDV